MSPIYAVLAAPLVRPLRVPLLLWFTHWRASRLLRRGRARFDRACSRSTGARSRSPRAKVRRDRPRHRRRRDPVRRARRTARCGCSRSAGPRPRRASTRSSRPCARCRPGVELELRGPVADRRGARIPGARSASGRGRRCRAREIAGGLRAAGALVNNMRSGALDKVVFEAAAVVPAGARLQSGLRRRSSAASSRRCSSRRTTRRRSPSGIRALLDAGPERARAIGRELRARVERDHSVEPLGGRACSRPRG